LPSTEPQASAALQAGGAENSVAATISKLAEVGYELLTGNVVTGEVSPGGANYIGFMKREA
jgi:hypothetical protein